MLTTTPVIDPYPQWSRRLAASDASALEELFHAMHDALLRYADGLVRDGATARDLVQDAFIRVWKRRAQLDDDLSLKALLYRTVRNLAFNHLRDELTRTRLLSEGYEPSGWRDPGPEATAEAHELQQQLTAWIAALPERQREALMLSRYEGLSHDEIAGVLGIAPRTVNNHLVRALQTLRDHLDARDAVGGAA
jgi:RNA polymerase sigma-70 factor (ECF subfamily)